MKIFSKLTSIRYSLFAVAILTSSLIGSASAHAESVIDYAKKTPKAYVLRVPAPITHQVPAYAGEIFQVLDSADFSDELLSGISPDSTLTISLGVSVIFGTVADAGGKHISIGWRDVEGTHQSSVDTNTLTQTFASVPSSLSFGIRYSGVVSTDSVVVVNPTVAVSTTNSSLQVADADLVYHFTEVGALPGPWEGSGERVFPTVTAHQGDASISFISQSLCIDVSRMSSGDVLVDQSSLWDGATSQGTNHPHWRPLDATYEPDFPLGDLSTYTLGDMVGRPNLRYTFGSTIDNPIPGTTYSIHDLKVTKQGDASGTNLLKGCGLPGATAVVATNAKTITVTVNVLGDVVNDLTLRFAKYSCNLYRASDVAHSTVLMSNDSVYNLDAQVISKASCVFNNVAPGYYSIGIRGVNTDYDVGTTSDEKIIVNGIAAGGAKYAAVIPKVATNVKVGKSLLVSTPLGKNSKGLVTTVSTSTKSVCSVTLIKNAAKKTSGYSVKGLKKGTCKLSVKVAGNAQNSAATVSKSVLVN